MKKKIVWLGVSSLTVAALVLTACPAPAVPGEQEEEEEEEEEGVPTLSIGETFQSPEIEVTVSEAIVTDSYEYYDEASESMATKEASPGTFFLIAHVEIKNVKEPTETAGRAWGPDDRIMEGPRRMFVSDAEGNEYKAEYEAESWAGKGAIEDALQGMWALKPGKRMDGKVVFIIPEGASDLKVFYRQKWPPIALAEWVIE